MWRLYYGYYLKYINKKSSLLFLIMCAILTSFFAISPILVMQKIIDLASTMNNKVIFTIVALSLLYLLMQVIGSGLNGFCVFFSQKLQKKLCAALQLDIYKKLTNINLAEFENKGSLDISNIIIEDTTCLSDNFVLPISKFFIAITSFIFALIYMLNINWLLTIIVFPLGLITSIVSNKLQSKLDDSISQKRDRSAILWKVFNETVLGIKTIRAFHVTDFFESKINLASEGTRKSGLEQSKIEAASEALLSALFMATIGGILLVSSIFLINGKISFGVMVAILMYNHMLVDPLLQLVDIQTALTKVKESVKRIEAIFEMPDYANTKYSTSIISNIIVEDLVFSYPKSNSKFIYNFELNFRDKLFFYGPSGIGKSTIAMLLTGLYKSAKGNISFFSSGLKLDNPPQIAYLEQDGYLFDSSIKENITLNTDDIFNERYNQILDLCCLNQLEKEIGDKEIGVNGTKLSGGQRKRVLLARTIYKEASIYVFDEVTASLDGDLISKILKNISTFLEDKIVIYIDHNYILSEYTSRIINLNETNSFLTIKT